MLTKLLGLLKWGKPPSRPADDFKSFVNKLRLNQSQKTHKQGLGLVGA